MSTPPPPHPTHHQYPGHHQQASAGYGQAPYEPAPGGYGQAPYPQTPGGYEQAPHPQAPAGYGQAPYPQAPAGYGQAPHPQMPSGYGQAAYQQAPGGYPAAPAIGCEVCGGVPAAPVTIRGHQGFLVIMRFLRREGTFCRSCALAVFRKMQADTLAMGWWGPMSMLITPITLLINLFTLSRIRKLPAAAAAQRPGLDPGRPVFGRPTGLVGIAPLTAFALLVLLVLVGLAAG
ncbi:hypothetical protein [Streptomyces roseochromogenus]|uniref:Uncharacterized protein n=1 Tax=Streptomyces roseochromogenus subsp. oscitans DS 12.976 TaxID=1352936 RepID=V6K937_STRRC|nr:hypothetical protein [Streptomyces roseochromogenus]EST27931.1 hypothetical protein M878_23935 [Streptomyces roseochromogenus subsp. oscitans DS 12.976]